MAGVRDYELGDPEVVRCPFGYYSAMREEHPVHKDPSTGWFFVTYYEDVAKVAQAYETFSSSTDILFRKTFTPAAQRVLDEAGISVEDTFTTSDPPNAHDFHAVGMQLFPPKKIYAITPQIRGIAEELVDDFGDACQADINRDFSRRLVGKLLVQELGLELADLDQFRYWSECTGDLMKLGITEEEEVRGVRKMVELIHYLAPRIEHAAKHGQPGTAIHTLATMNRRDGQPFTANQRCWMTLITFTGAHNTTINMLNIDVMTLAMNAALQGDLRANPEKIDQFVEEMLRLEGTAQSIVRRTTRDIELRGTEIPQGAHVLVSLGSANRDEAKWGGEAAALSLDRPDKRRHVAFGSGLHTCVGKHLARAELRISLEVLLRRLDNIRLKSPENPPAYLTNPFQRGVESLEVTFDKFAAPARS